MINRRYITIAVAALSIVSAGKAASAHTVADLEKLLSEQEHYAQITNYPAPDFTLQDATGRQVRLTDFRGKIVILNFIYASCKEACPLQSDAIVGIQRMVNSRQLRDAVQFVSITTDPERDTAEVLNAYGPAHGFDPANWSFLTSGTAKPAETREVGERYGLKFTRVADGDFVHGVVTHVIDQAGVLRARFHGLNFDPVNLVDYVSGLSTGDYEGAEQLLKSREPTKGVAQAPRRSLWELEVWAPIAVSFGVGSIVLVFLIWRTLHSRRGDKQA